MKSIKPADPLEWTVTTVSILSFFLLLLTLFYMFVPVSYKGPGMLGFAALFAPPVFVAVAAIFLLLFYLAWRRKWRLAFAASGLSAILALLVAALPLYSLMERAEQYQVELESGEVWIPKMNQGDTTGIKTVSYSQTREGRPLMLDFWSAKGDVTALKPAIVKVHGGGWVHGSRKGMTGWNVWFNAHGYHVFDVEYRMPTTHPEGWDWKNEIADVKCALVWLKQHAAEYRVDTTRVILMGYSAGANLAMLAAYSTSSPTLTSSCEGSPIKIAGVIDFYGPVDMNSEFLKTGGPGYVHDVMQQYIGGSPDQYRDRYDRLSPYHYAGTAAPPTIAFYGEKDRVVPYDQGKQLAYILDRVMVPFEIYYLPFSDHGFDANWTSFSTQIARAKIEQWLSLVQR